jgi:saccharopine dehydrogenase-like NADP-dependent oxidoreductase
MHEDAVILFDRFHQTGTSLRAREKAGRLALVGIGVEPGLSDVFAGYAADHLFPRSANSALATAPTSPLRL